MIIFHNYRSSFNSFTENRLVFKVEKPSAEPTPEELASKKEYEKGGLAGLKGMTQEKYEAGLEALEAAASTIGQPKEKPKGPRGEAYIGKVEVYGPETPEAEESDTDTAAKMAKWPDYKDPRRSSKRETLKIQDEKPEAEESDTDTAEEKES